MSTAPAPRRKHYHTLKTYACALLALGIGGIVPAYCSASIYKEQKACGLQPPLPSPDRSDALSQQLAFFTLGGLRSLVAEIYTLDATDAWSKRDWPRLRSRWESATTLMPRRLNYWINAENDMTSNAAGDVIRNRKLSRSEQENAYREYIKLGENFLLEGIANNPQSWKLYTALAEHYGNLYRLPQFDKAIDTMKKAIELGAPEYYKRVLFYNLCRVPGREQEAWQLGRSLFENEMHRVPSVHFLLFALQNKIQVPAAEALSIDQLYRTDAGETEEEVLQRAIREIELFSNNDLLYPTYGVKEFLQKHATTAENELRPD
ncbi:MAG: hypothetical protein E7031_00290 [Akkermansiaceae bacterium]|nr:hypothetical protein [Akkermansiaceae bacterium]